MFWGFAFGADRTVRVSNELSRLLTRKGLLVSHDVCEPVQIRKNPAAGRICKPRGVERHMQMTVTSEEPSLSAPVGGRGVFARNLYMLHYHGTPITPRAVLETLGGENFCISYAEPRDLKVCLKIGQSLMLDNGAFSAKTRGIPFDPKGFYDWLDPILGHPHWGVVPDVIDGTEEEQRQLVKSWPYPKSLGVPVWHLGLSLDYLCELVDDWGKVCLGSSGEYWNVGSQKWQSRMDETFNHLSKVYGRLPWTHGMRMLGQGLERWPLSSADSTNLAVNHKSMKECAYCIAKRIDSENPTTQWSLRPVQEHLCF